MVVSSVLVCGPGLAYGRGRIGVVCESWIKEVVEDKDVNLALVGLPMKDLSTGN